MKTSIMTAIALAAVSVLANTPPEITNVRASQREGTKLVDIYYDAADADGDALKIRVEISDNDGAKYSVPALTFTGDIGEGVTPGTNKHIVWDAGTDWDGEYSDQMRVKIYAIDAKGFPGLEWGNEVPPGGFLMGQDGGAEGSGPSRHVNIPWSYWLSKYEISNQQFCDFLNAAIAAGLIERDGSVAVYAKVDKQLISHLRMRTLLAKIGDGEDIRWNVNNFEVVNSRSNMPVRVTWYGAMAFANFYGYDIPTEAEWEKAARGPDSDDQDEHMCYPWGNEISPARCNYYESSFGCPVAVGQYDGNQVPIGGDMVNGYGLYDMSGNVAEWTLSSGDHGIEEYPARDSLTALRNEPANVSCRAVTRGGSWYSGYYSGWYDNVSANDASRRLGALQCFARVAYSRDTANAWTGFRVIRRHGAERIQEECEVSCTFDDWALRPAQYYGSWDETNSGGFTTSGYVGVIADGYQLPGRCFQIGSGGSGGSLIFPSFTNSTIVAICCKVKNQASYAQDMTIYYSGVSINSGHSVSIPAGAEFQERSVQVPVGVTDVRLTSYYGVLVDDIKVWTIPKGDAK